jgi:2-dehydropantoate 2-reductase
VKIAVYGAGAIGGFLGAKLMAGGADVTFIARGAHLAAMREHGLTLISEGETATLRPRCCETASQAGPQDYIIVTLKAHSLPAAAPQIAAMLGKDTTLVTAINGVPYWYCYGLEGPWRDRRIESVDPGGTLWDLLPPAHVLGCVVYPAAEVIEPGVIAHTYGDRFSLGEPDESRSGRAEALSLLMINSGLRAPVRNRIRDEIWVKLWGNLCFNPVSALTGATLDRFVGEPDLRGLCQAMMSEAQRVGERLGARFSISLDKRLAGAAEVGVHKTSMLQDLERGRPIEVDALLGAVVELGQMTAEPMPICTSVLALVRERGRQAGCYPTASLPGAAHARK